MKKLLVKAAALLGCTACLHGAGVKVSEMTSVSTLASNDIIMAVSNVAGTPTNMSINLHDFMGVLGGTASFADATNGFVGPEVTNGLASTNYAQSITNGLAGIDLVTDTSNALETAKLDRVVTNQMVFTNWLGGMFDGVAAAGADFLAFTNGVISWTAVPGAGGGEANDGLNVGSGVGIYSNKAGATLVFKSISGASQFGTTWIVATTNDTDLTIGLDNNITNWANWQTNDFGTIEYIASELNAASNSLKTQYTADINSSSNALKTAYTADINSSSNSLKTQYTADINNASNVLDTDIAAASNYLENAKQDLDAVLTSLSGLSSTNQILFTNWLLAKFSGIAPVAGQVLVFTNNGIYWTNIQTGGGAYYPGGITNATAYNNGDVTPLTVAPITGLDNYTLNVKSTNGSTVFGVSNETIVMLGTGAGSADLYDSAQDNYVSLTLSGDYAANRTVYLPDASGYILLSNKFLGDIIVASVSDGQVLTADGNGNWTNRTPTTPAETTIAAVRLQTNMVDVGEKTNINFVAGANITLLVTNGATNVSIAIASTASGGDASFSIASTNWVYGADPVMLWSNLMTDGTMVDARDVLVMSVGATNSGRWRLDGSWRYDGSSSLLWTNVARIMTNGAQSPAFNVHFTNLNNSAICMFYPAAATETNYVVTKGFLEVHGIPNDAPSPPVVYNGPLDLYNTAVLAAYSVSRRLTTNYAGSAIKVVLADGSTQDIGFSDNALDTTALASFCSGTVGFITNIYDQSGNGYHLAITDTNHAPVIYTNGAVLTISNNFPAVRFHNDGVGQYGVTNPAPQCQDTMTYVIVGTVYERQVTGVRYICGPWSGTEATMQTLTNAADAIPFFQLNSGAAGSVSTNANWTTNCTYVWTATFNGASAGSSRFNNATNATVTTGTTVPTTGLCLGSRAALASARQYAAEWLVFTNVLSDANKNILHTNAAIYYGTSYE